MASKSEQALAEKSEISVASPEAINTDENQHPYRPLLAYQMENRGSPIKIETPKPLSSEQIQIINSTLGHAPDEKFRVELSEVRDVKPLIWAEIKELTAVRLVAEVETRREQAREDESTLGKIGRREMTRMRQLGKETGFDESGPLTGVRSKLDKFDVDYKGTETAVAILESNVDSLASILKDANVDSELVTTFRTYMNAGIAKAASDKLLRLTGDRESGMDLFWRADEDLRTMLELAESVEDTLLSIPDEKTKRAMGKEVIQKQDQALIKLQGKLMNQMLRSFHELSLSSTEERHTYDVRTSNITRSLTGYHYDPELTKIAELAEPEDLIFRPGGHPSHDFRFEDGKNILTNELVDQRLPVGEAEVITMSLDIFRSNVVRGIHENIVGSQLIDDGEFANKVASTLLKSLKPNAELTRNIEKGIDLFQTITLNYNDKDSSSQLDTDLPVRVMEGIVIKQVASVSSKSFEANVNMPINAQVEEDTELANVLASRNIAVAEGLNNLIAIYDESVRDPNRLGSPEYRKKLSASYLYVAKALKAADEYAETHTGNLGGRPPVAVPQLSAETIE